MWKMTRKGGDGVVGACAAGLETVGSWYGMMDSVL